jgi:endonuclease/exonuclease/phosphatase (EEP) superfamily protein YafD
MDQDYDDEDGGIWPELVGIGLTLAIILVLLGYTGWLHSFGDSLAVGRGLAVAAVFVLAIAASMLGMRIAAFWSILFALLAGTPVVFATLWPGPTGSISVYQKNLRFDNSDLPALIADMRRANPMALTLQEVSQANLVLLEDLADLFPHQLVCPSSAVGGVAVASRLPPVPGAEVCVPGLAAMQVTLKETNREIRVWIVSVHLHWPWPYGQSDHADILVQTLAGLDGPVLMAGDFNMVRWGHTVQRMARAARAEAAGPSPGTYLGFAPLLRLPIDHAFAPSSGRIEVRGQFGSDHLGLLAWLEP